MNLCYLSLADMKSEGMLSAKSIVISTYALWIFTSL